MNGKIDIVAPGAAQGRLQSARQALKAGQLVYGALLGRPFMVNWQVTRRCNFQCRICSFWKDEQRAGEELDLDAIGQVVRLLKPLAPLIVSLGGGEPLLRDDLPGIVAAVGRDHFVSLITNGWLMSPGVARDLYASGLGDVNVSIDYADPELHDAQRGQPGAFSRALEAVEVLCRTRPDRGHRVRILAVLMDDNVDQLEGLMGLAEEFGVTFALSLYSHRRGRKPDLVPHGPVSDYLNELRGRHPCFASSSQYLQAIDGFLQGAESAACQAGRAFFDLDELGRVSRCIDRNDEPVGGLLQESLDCLLKRLKDGALNEPCRACWTSCRGLTEFLSGPRGVFSLPEVLRSLRAD